MCGKLREKNGPSQGMRSENTDGRDEIWKMDGLPLPRDGLKIKKRKREDAESPREHVRGKFIAVLTGE